MWKHISGGRRGAAWLVVAVASAVLLSVVSDASAQRRRNRRAAQGSQEETPSEEAKLSQAEALQIAVDAYVYGYPLVVSEMTRRIMTNVEKPHGARAPMGRLANLREYPGADFRDVTAPNADTLYSAAWLDLEKEPWVFSYPDLAGRFALYPMYSLWTNVFDVPGSRTTGEKGQTVLLTGPRWKGKAPEGMRLIASPTRYVCILGRTYCTGTPDDYKKVRRLQDQYKVQPLSTRGKPYAAPPGKVDPRIDMKTPTRDQVNAMPAEVYFKMLADLMKDNPPAPEDGPILARLAKIGIEPGKTFDVDKLPPEAAKAIQGAPKAGWAKIAGHFKNAGKDVNGWTFPTQAGVYGTDYLQRAFIAAFGWGANLPQDAVYPSAEVDAKGQRLNGARKYVIRFKSKAELPPARGFWSLTMYDDRWFFVDNPLKRYTLSQRNDLKANADGSIDLWIQKDSPGKDKETNWLPAAAGDMILMLRLYWPTETPPSIIDGSWKPPAVQRVD
jgi:hypothetical protein